MWSSHLLRGMVTLGCLSACAGVPAGERFALLVGVREYPPAGLRSLQFTEADIEGLRIAMIDGGYKPSNVRLLHGERGADAAFMIPDDFLIALGSHNCVRSHASVC